MSFLYFRYTIFYFWSPIQKNPRRINNMDRYYVVQTKPQRELLAVSEIQNQGFPTFLPMIQRDALASLTKSRIRLAPLFPKYVFVQFDKNLDQWRSLNGTRGVIRVMCMSNEEPSPVPTFVMERLLMAGELIMEEKSLLPFNLGDTTEFVEGPMQGRKGLVQACSADRVTVLLSLLGGQVAVHCVPKALRYVGRQGIVEA
jgi:transcriptional antiterminator RfaH